ncbi:hypothetical protein CU633_02775 [Bacillus sp. V3-13]|uniref:DUF2512 family protein n=1 Tax=Bacillus sp. V3-13 TaxID=2053728 RepID=UPI000C79113C|nr:DUF2512 family protein [Bacillus sp. V3-13]PLR78969.1 hypothetical protein CU633_02775 [Bacillus sp. V3-13]
MRHALAISIKFIATLIILGLILGLFYNLGFTEVLIITVVFTALSYILGDLFILRRTNNLSASLADFGIAFIVIYFMSTNMAYGDDFFTASLFSAAVITFFEYLYHRIVPGRADRREITAGIQNETLNNSRFQTEAAEELTPVRPDVRSPKKNNSKKKT